MRATTGDVQVTLSWDANTEPDFLQYNIYGGTSASPTARVAFNVGISNTTKTISGLINGVTYYFRITAVDSAQQESGFSNEVGVTPNALFTRITTGDIVNDSGLSGGCSWGDYDNDGDLDLFVSNLSDDDNFLYSNNSDGTFTKITVGEIVNDGGKSVGSSWGDYDNDGDLDLFVANEHGQNNFLYQNSGNGTFSKITIGAIVVDGGNSLSTSWGDYDNDGNLDLYVANSGNNNFLYQNNGDGTFTSITTSTIVEMGNFRGCNWVDYDNDGDLDLFVAIWGDNNFLYANNGNGTFNTDPAPSFPSASYVR
ncbi:MAG: FG-GAP-like repeat-containing protein, partial [bacterium]